MRYLWMVFVLGMVLFGQRAFGQENDPFAAYVKRADKMFQKRVQSDQERFEELRAESNRQFAEYLNGNWMKSAMSEPLVAPQKPLPEPVVCETPVEPTVNEELPAPVVVEESSSAVTYVGEKERVFQEQKGEENFDTIVFDFYDNKCRVRVPKTERVKIASEKDVVRFWGELCSKDFDNLLHDCSVCKTDFFMCDWAFYEFVKRVASLYCGDDVSASSVFEMYVLSQFGYKARLVRLGGDFEIFLSFKGSIYDVPYIEMDGSRFFYFGESAKTREVEICDFEFKGEREFNPVIGNKDGFPCRFGEEKEYKINNEGLSVGIRPNKNLISFYEKYPQCDFSVLAMTSLSNDVKEQLYPVFRELLSGKGEVEAVNVVLNFVQTAFDYKTDEEQFGREKYFFADEMFYYPYNDCEDRSVLFATMVRDLLNLDVVFVIYPSEHAATAVKFTDGAHGDYFTVDGAAYTMCDPTYIGAPVGLTMPDMKNKQVTLLKID